MFVDSGVDVSALRQEGPVRNIIICNDQWALLAEGVAG